MIKGVWGFEPRLKHSDAESIIYPVYLLIILHFKSYNTKSPNSRENIWAFFIFLYLNMIAYKFKGISVEDGKLCIKYVQKFNNGKFEKTVSPYDALEFAHKIVMYEKDFDNIMAHTEYKTRYREREQKLF